MLDILDGDQGDEEVREEEYEPEKPVGTEDQAGPSSKPEEEFDKASLQRKLMALEGELSAKQTEVLCLKTSVAELSSSRAAIEASLAGTKHELEAARAQVTALNTECGEQKNMLEEGVAREEAQAGKLRWEETERRRLHNIIQEMKGNIRVFCRLRPEGDDSEEEEEDDDTPPGHVPVPFMGGPGNSEISSTSPRRVDHNKSLAAKLKNMHRGNLGTGRFAGVFKDSTFVAPSSSNSDTPKALTYQPQVSNLTQYERHLAIVEARRQHQLELIKQQCEYGPLGVKLWFSKEESSKIDSDDEEASKPNRAPEEDHVIHHNDKPEFTRKDPEEASFTKKEFTIQEPLKPIVPETLEEWMANVIMKETFRRIDKKAKKREKKRLEALRQEVAGEGKSMGDIEDLLKQSKEEEPDFICKMCNLVFVSRKHYEVHKVSASDIYGKAV